MSIAEDNDRCRWGYIEYDGDQYCFAHGGFRHYTSRTPSCDRRPKPAPEPLPIHRTEAGYPRCATCDGGGCPDCTDPS